MKNKIVFLVVVFFATVFPCFGAEPNKEPNSAFNIAEARILALEQRLVALEQRINRLELNRTPASPAAEVPKVNSVQKQNNRTDAAPLDDEAKSALRIQRLSKQIQEMRDAIEITDKKIEMLPPIPLRYLGIHSLPRATTIQSRTDRSVDRSGTSARTTTETTPSGTSETTVRDSSQASTNMSAVTITRIYEEHIYIPGKHCDYKLHKDECPEIREVLQTTKEAYRLCSEEEMNYKKILQLAEKNPDLGINVMDAKKDLIECQGRKDIAELMKECIRSIIQDNRELFNIVPW